MCFFGDRFDRDDRLPWARQILESIFPFFALKRWTLSR